MAFSTTRQPNPASTHHAHLLTSLTRRLEAARARQDQPLLAALQHEQEQLTAFSPNRSLGNQLEQTWMGFSETLSDWSKVQIEQTSDRQGNPGWYAYNPQSGEAVFTQTKEEVDQWIKSSYWGKSA